MGYYVAFDWHNCNEFGRAWLYICVKICLEVICVKAWEHAQLYVIVV